MEDAAFSEERDEQPDLLQGEVARMVESAGFHSGYVRKVRRLLRSMTDGCIVIVVDGGNVAQICQVKQFMIGPTEM